MGRRHLQIHAPLEDPGRHRAPRSAAAAGPIWASSCRRSRSSQLPTARVQRHSRGALTEAKSAQSTYACKENGGGGGRLLVEVVEVFWGLDFVHQTALFVKPSQVWSAVLDLTAKHGLGGRVSIDDKERRNRPARGAEIAFKGGCTKPASHHLGRGLQAVGGWQPTSVPARRGYNTASGCRPLTSLTCWRRWT